MNHLYKTEQERFWAGDFGDEYAQRNWGARWIASNMALFSRILARTAGVNSIIEFGANIGLNLHALHSLLPDVELAAVEINSHATDKLRDWGKVSDVQETSLLEFAPQRTWDMALIKGVLIHIHPDQLTHAYEVLYRSADR